MTQNNGNQVEVNKFTNCDKRKIYKTKYIFLLILLILIISFLFYFFMYNTSLNNNEDKNANVSLQKCNEKNDIEYKLIFDTVGGNKIKEIVIKNDDKSNESIPTPVKNNSIFEGWYYDNLYNKRVETDKVKEIVAVEHKDSQGCILSYEDVVLYAKWKENNIISDSELYSKLNELMLKKEYNDYAIKIINSFINDYQKLFSNEEIYNLFNNVTGVVLNPYDPNNPNLTRAYNSGGKIVINCFEGELENDNNWNGLRALLTHEIMHSLGEFPSEYADGSFGNSLWVRNTLLEEGMADSIAIFVKGTDHNNKFAIKSQNDFKMYSVDSNYNVLENSIINHSYTIFGNVVSVFKYIGCYDELLHANINSSFHDLKTCMTNNVKNGDVYFDRLFTNINNIYLYIEYPNKFNSKSELIERYKYYNELNEFIENNNLNDLLIQYANLSSEIINNKTDNTYSICDFYKNNVIFYDLGSNEYKTNLDCQ